MGFQQGLSGLNAASRNLDVIGNNIANANTVGMKASRAEFAELYAASIGSSGGTGLGVTVAAVTQQFTQGSINVTGNNLDVAINGGGMFEVIKPNGALAYTRDGQFKLDKDGNLRTNAGAFVRGFPTNKAGEATSSVPDKLTIPTTQPILANPTTSITAGFNLDARSKDASQATASGLVPSPRSTFGTSITVYDAQGVASPASLYFVKVDAMAFNPKAVTGALPAATAAARAATANTDAALAATAAATAALSASASTTAAAAAATAGAAHASAVTFAAIKNAAAISTADTQTTTPSAANASAAALAAAAKTSADNDVTNKLAAKTSADTAAATAATAATAAGTAATAATSTAAASALLSTRYGSNKWDVFTTLDATAQADAPFTIVFDSSGKIQGTIDNATGVTTSDEKLTIPPGTFLSNNPNETMLSGGVKVLPNAITVDISGVSQFGTKFSVSNLSQDGYTAGDFTGLNIDDTGVITTTYSNGQTMRTGGMIALANFQNMQGLDPIGGGEYQANFKSGPVNIGQPSIGKNGALRAGAVEDSNVDLTSELVNMMIAQRSYQANAQTIKTQDQALSTLLNMR